MFYTDVIDEKSAEVVVAVCEMPGAEVAQGHEEGDGDEERDEEAKESVADKGARPLAREGGQHEDAADQEHEGHEEDVVKVFEDIEAVGAHGIDDGVGGRVIGLFVKAGEGRIGEG